MSTRASWTWKVGIRSASSMTTSGAPLPAVTAVWNLSYSSPPAPAFVQQTWTSSCWVLKLSTTFCMFGYQAQSVTTGASLFLMVLVQLADLLSPLVVAVLRIRRGWTRSATEVAATAMTDLVFTGLSLRMPDPSSGTGTAQACKTSEVRFADRVYNVVFNVVYNVVDCRGHCQGVWKTVKRCLENFSLSARSPGAPPSRVGARGVHAVNGCAGMARIRDHGTRAGRRRGAR